MRRAGGDLHAHSSRTDQRDNRGLVAFDEKQKKILTDKNKKYSESFAEKMADLLAAKAGQQKSLENAEMSRDEMLTILETAHEGILALDQRGCVKHCNNRNPAVFSEQRREILREGT